MNYVLFFLIWLALTTSTAAGLIAGITLGKRFKLPLFTGLFGFIIVLLPLIAMPLGMFAPLAHYETFVVGNQEHQEELGIIAIWLPLIGATLLFALIAYIIRIGFALLMGRMAK